MNNSVTHSTLSFLLELIPDTHISDYSYLNIIDLHIANIERELIELEKEKSETAYCTILAVWRRMRRYYEMCGRYTDGIKFASIFRNAAQKLELDSDAAWILLKDDLWLRILSGEQGKIISESFDQAIKEMSKLYFIGKSLKDRRDGGIGLFTVYRYMVGYLRYHQAPLSLSTVQFSSKVALQKCGEVLNMLESDGLLTDESLGPLKARHEQTSGNVTLGLGDAQDALSHYDQAAYLFLKYAPDDDEHMAIIKCYQAQGHIELAKLAFHPDSYRGANRFSSEFRKNNRISSSHLMQAVELLLNAYLHSSRADWAEGFARISEHMANAFDLEGKVDLALMYAKNSLELYRKLGNQKHVGRLEELIKKFNQKNEQNSTKNKYFHILVVGRMRDEIDTERLLSIKNLCNSITLETQLIYAKRVDDIVDKAGGRITDALIDGLWSADLVVAILDGISPNVLYEIGVAHGYGKPVVLCLSDDVAPETIPFDLKDYHIIRFRSCEDLSQCLIDPIIDELRANGHKINSINRV